LEAKNLYTHFVYHNFSTPKNGFLREKNFGVEISWRVEKNGRTKFENLDI